MNFTFKSSAPVVYVDISSEINIDELLQGAKRVDIILSPSFYWVKKQSLPLKYVRDVKPLLPSIFEDSVPEGNYSYSIYKLKTETKAEDGTFVMMAYSDKFILDTLAELGIKSSQIRNIYLAQSEFNTLEGSFKIDDNSTIVVKDGIVAQLPSTLVPQSEAINLQDTKLSKLKIELVRFSHIVDTKSMLQLSAFLFVFILISSVEYGVRSYEIQSIEAEKETIFEKKHLKSTMFQNEALANKLKKRLKVQTKLREYIAIITTLPLLKDESIEDLELKSKKLLLHIKLTDSKRAAKIKSYFRSKKINIKAKMKKKTLKVEIKL